MQRYEFKDLKPVDNNVIEKKINNSKNYANILLFLNLKGKQNPSSTTVGEITKFFMMEQSYVFKILEFFCNCGLVHKVRQTMKLIYYVPNEKEISKYIDLAYKRIKDQAPVKREKVSTPSKREKGAE